MQLKKHMDDGDVLVLKEVYDELLRQDDELAGWVKENCQNCQISISDLPSMLKYQLVLEYIESCDLYSLEAVEVWNRESMADPKLIASALANGYVIVTFEISAGNGRNRNRKTKKIKIPDIAADLGVTTVNLFDMMRTLQFRL